MDRWKEDVSPYLLRPLRCVEDVLAERARHERGTAPGAGPRCSRLRLVYDMPPDGAGPSRDRS